MSDRSAVGVDVGGTKIAALRMTVEGSIEASTVIATPASDQDAALPAIEAAIASVIDDDVVAIGIGMAGLVDARTGVLLTTPNLVWRNLPLEADLAPTFSLPVTRGQRRDGRRVGRTVASAPPADYDDSLFVGVGTGIGGGIVMGGRLVRGAHGLAGEIGHVIVEPDGPACGCGNRGCWEQVASGLAIARAGARTVADDPGSAIGRLVGGDPRRVTGEVVSQAAREGDAAAIAILAEVGRRLGEGVAGLVNVLDPEIVVIGGGASEAGELLLAPLRAAFLASLEGADVRPEVPIVAAALGNDAGAIGAGLLALGSVAG